MASNSSQVVAMPAAGAAQGVSRADNQGESNPLGIALGLLKGGNRYVEGLRFAQLVKEVAETFAVFRLADGLQGSAQQTQPILVQHTSVSQGNRQIQTGLPSQGRQQTVGPLSLYDPLQHLHDQRLDVDAVGDPLVGHDGSWVGVD